MICLPVMAKSISIIYPDINGEQREVLLCVAGRARSRLASSKTTPQILSSMVDDFLNQFVNVSDLLSVWSS